MEMNEILAIAKIGDRVSFGYLKTGSRGERIYVPNCGLLYDLNHNRLTLSRNPRGSDVFFRGTKRYPLNRVDGLKKLVPVEEGEE